MSTGMDRPFRILPLVRPHLDGGYLGRRRNSPGGSRAEGWPDWHDPDVERHIAGGCGRHAEILWERHGKRGRTMMRDPEDGNRSGRDRSSPTAGRNKDAEPAALI